MNTVALAETSAPLNAAALPDDRPLLDLQRLELLAAVGHRVVHDFNNILQAVIGHVQLASLDLPARSPSQGAIDEVLKAALRGADLCRQFFAYSASQRSSGAVCEPSQVIRESSGLLRTALGRGVRIDCALADNLPEVATAPVALQQILFNLAFNAAEAIGRRPGVVTIATGRAWLRPAQSGVLAGGRTLPEGEYAYLEVADNGGGVPARVAERMFEPNFTTKTGHRGLGLTSVLELTHALGGAVWFENRLGDGATFRVYLPPYEVAAVA